MAQEDEEMSVRHFFVVTQNLRHIAGVSTEQAARTTARIRVGFVRTVGFIGILETATVAQHGFSSHSYTVFSREANDVTIRAYCIKWLPLSSSAA